MSESFAQTFAHQLIGDHLLCAERLAATDTQANRRDFIRATFSAVEGLLWRMKLEIVKTQSIHEQLSIHERAALHEESYSVDRRGNVQLQPRYLPLAVSVRLVVGVIHRFRPKYKLDFEHPGWQYLCNSIEVRNRIVHPKNLSELTVTDNEVKECQAGFAWFLAFVIEGQEEHLNHLRELKRAREGRSDV